MRYYGKVCHEVKRNIVTGLFSHLLEPIGGYLLPAKKYMRSETSYGEKQNSSHHKWKKFSHELFQTKEVLEMPNLIEVQKDSYQWFLDEGLKEVFDDISPISDYAGHFSLEFVDFTLCEDDVKYTIEECKERDATYAAPLKVRVRLYNRETDEINEHEIFMGISH